MKRGVTEWPSSAVDRAAARSASAARADALARRVGLWMGILLGILFGYGMAKGEGSPWYGYPFYMAMLTVVFTLNVIAILALSTLLLRAFRFLRDEGWSQALSVSWQGMRRFTVEAGQVVIGLLALAGLVLLAVILWPFISGLAVAIFGSTVLSIAIGVALGVVLGGLILVLILSR